MKRKGIYSFILLLLCLACVVSSLASCGGDERDALKSSVDQLEEDTAGLNEQLRKQNQELTQKIEEVKAIADAAASTAELNAAIDRLGKVETVANAAATSEALEAAKTALEALMNTKLAQYDPASADSVKTAIAKIEALKERCTETETTLKETTDEVSGLKDALETLTTTVNETLQKQVTKLGDDLTALTERVEALEKKGATKDDIGRLETTIKEINAAVKTLQETVDGLVAADFAKNYNEATEILNGTKLEGKYSLSAFDAKVSEIKAEDYLEDEYAKFKTTVERLRFFLGRAISETQIKEYFQELDAAIEAMPSILESLTELVNAFMQGGLISDKSDCLKDLKDFYGKVQEEIPESTENNYRLIVEAHENLLSAKAAAEEVNAAICAIATPIVYKESEAPIAATEELYNAFCGEYFSDEQYMVLYAEGINADTFVTEHKTLEGYRARLGELDTAFGEKPEVISEALRFVTYKPLFSDNAVLDANMAAVEDWKTKYKVEDENVEAMYGDQVNTLAKACAYANAMQTIYTEQHKVEELVANLTALNGKTPIVYTDYADAKAYQTALGALDEAIKAVENYDSDTDHNMETMVADACRKTFAEVCARMDELKDADDLVKEQMNEMKALLGNVKFGDQSKIDAWSEAIEKIRAEHTIGDKDSNDSNYDTIVKPAVEMLQTLQGQYDEATAKIAEIYKIIQETLSGVNEWYLQDGQTLLNMQSYWNELMDPDTGYGVTNLDNDIQITVDGERKNVNLAKLYRGDWAKCLALYKTVAVKAQEESQTITEAIGALSGKVFNDLKNYNEVLSAWNDFAAWANTYLGIDVNAENAEDTVKMIEAIQGIKIIGSEPAEYVFVSTENYQALAGAHATATKTHEDAEAAWAEINAGMTGLTGSWTIHSDFDTVEGAYLAYVKAYYAGEISETGLFGEVTVYNAFSEAKGEYEAKCKEAKNDAKQIKDAIAALEDPTFENAQSVIDATAAIRTMIEQYKSKYGCDLPCTEGCDVTPEEALKLVKYEAKADYTKQYADVYATLTEEADRDILRAAWDSANSSMNSATSVKAAQNVLSNAEAVLQSFIKEHQSSGEVTGD